MSYKSKKKNLAADLHHNQNHNIFFNGYDSQEHQFSDDALYYAPPAVNSYSNNKVFTP